MGALFKIFHFASSNGVVSELKEKINRGEQVAESLVIKRGDSFSVRMLEGEIYPCYVLLLNTEDLAYLLPFLQEEGKNGRVNNMLLICVNDDTLSKESVVRSYPNVTSVSDSAEQIRVEMLDFYRKTIKGSLYSASFVGRTQEIEQFQNLLYSERFLITKSVVVSGHPGVGREAFARECIRMSSAQEAKEPCIISMGDNGSIEIFIVQLNAFLRTYDEAGILKLLGADKDEKVEAAVSLLNQLFSYDRHVIVYDDSRVCIRFDRKLADWFLAIIDSPYLKGKIRLYVISTVSINYSRAKIQDGVAFFTLYDLSRSDRKKLIYHRLSELGKVAPEDDVNFILDSSIYSPQMIIRIVDDYSEDKHGISYVKSHMDEYLSIGDSKMRALLLKYKESPEIDLWNLLVLLSKIEYISEGVLSSIFKDTFDIVQRHLDMLIANGLVERFGEMDDYYRLESSVSDNIRRNKDRYKDPFFKEHVDEVMTDVIAGNPKITEDYSAYLYKVKEDLKKDNKYSNALLIPSIVLSSLIEAYDSTKYDKTVGLCDWILEQKPHYFNDVYREVRYWKCLALARLKDKRFFESVDYFKYNADYHFLMGFMYRIKQEYSRAEKEYRLALQQNPSFSRAKRELVIALLGQHRFSDALALAKENYERDSENTYHLLAYYRCLVRKYNLSHAERQEVEALLDAAKGLFSSDYYNDGMRFEYNRFVAKKPIDDLIKDVRRLEQLAKETDSPYLKDIVSDFNVLRGTESTIEITDLDGEFDK